MILNLLLIIFLGLMAFYWGSVQGLFSGLLHLIAVIVAGALALALWEPLVLGFLINRMPEMAWGLGLAGPFVLILAIVRFSMDRLILANMQFHSIINIIVGGVFGLAAGILTAGMILISISMLPLQDDFMGWQPMVLDQKGKAVANPDGQLWVPVDRMTSGFYDALSAGALGRGKPISEHRASLVETAHRARIRLDANASIVALPEGITVDKVYQMPLPVAGLNGEIAGPISEDVRTGSTIVMVNTRFEVKPGTYDPDGALRIAPAQVLLVTRPTGKADEPVTLQPKAVSVRESGAKRPTVQFLNNSTNYARLNAKGDLGWLFALPTDHEPMYLIIRGLRLTLSKVEKPAATAMVAAIGRLPGDDTEVEEQVIAGKTPAKPGPGGTTTRPGGTTTTPPRATPGAPGAPGGTTTTPPSTTGTVTQTPGRVGTRADAIELTNMLPTAVSANMLGPIRLEGQAIFSGKSDVGAPGANLNAQTRVESIHVPGHRAMVRLKMSRDDAQSIFGRARAQATMLQPIYIVDNNGEQYYPIGYVWVRKAGNGSQMIAIDRTQEIRAARDLPIAEMQPGEELYLYFLVPKGIQLRAYHLGATIKQDLSLTIPR